MSFFPTGSVLAPILTPLDADYRVIESLWCQHAHRILAEGCAGLVPFGTTGEANSLGAETRMKALESLIVSGISPEILVPGTGHCAFEESLRLTQHAANLGCPAVMLLPPFYYKDIDDEALYEWVSGFVRFLDRPKLKIWLYHIPRMSGIGFSISLLKRLKRDFPEQLDGIKDSSADPHFGAQLRANLPELRFWSGSENAMLEILSEGGAGVITALANINAPALAETARTRSAKTQEKARRFRETLSGFGFIPAMKKWLAETHKQADWQRTAPPLRPLDAERYRELHARLARLSEAV